MFGSYTIDVKKPDRAIRINLTFNNGEINLYACPLKYLEGDLNTYYDWSADVMNDQGDKKNAKATHGKLICDALLDQTIFAEVGSIIKNEILYRVQVHPESIIEKIPNVKINKLIDETRIYSFQFLEWKRNFELKKHWLAHTKKRMFKMQPPLK